MTEQECLDRMVAPGARRPGKYRDGVIQIHITRACDLACFNCTQGSNFGGKPTFITPDQFEEAVLSLKGYFGVVGVFGGNPAMHPDFDLLCAILRKHVPFEHRGLWCNNPRGWGRDMRATFDPSVSNLNVHLSRAAYNEFKRDWPECSPVGLTQDSRHAPVLVAMKDVIQDESRIWELISGCDINQHWSAMIGVFRGQLRAWFCEVAGAQAMLHQDEPDYPDTGMDLKGCYIDSRPAQWWQMGMSHFTRQVRKHCFDCGVPLRGRGELAQSATGSEQVSATHAGIARSKRLGRPVQVVDNVEQLGVERLQKITKYLQNAGL